MYPPKPLSTKVVMSLLTVLLALGATFGNGLILVVIARFKSFRTVPNTLLANLAVVDMLNAVINTPIYTISFILEAGWFRGQGLAIMSSFFNRLFMILNLASMLALMANAYFVVDFCLKFRVWKSNWKAVVSSFIIWFSGTLIVVLFSIPLLRIDLGDVQVIEYRAKIYQQGKYYIAAFMALFIICSGILGCLTINAIKRKKMKRAKMDLSALGAQARLRSDINASKTIAITIAAYFISYVPAVTYAILGQQDVSQTDSWFAFIAWYATFFSSAVNPFIFYYRTSRFRAAIKQFFKDPFGKSDFKEEPTKPRKSGNRIAVKEDSGGKNRGRNETLLRRNYHGKRRNGFAITSIPALKSHLYSLEPIERKVKANEVPKEFGIISAALVHPVSAVELSSAVAQLSFGGNEKSAQKPFDKKDEEKNLGSEMVWPQKKSDATSKRTMISFSKSQVHPSSKS